MPLTWDTGEMARVAGQLEQGSQDVGSIVATLKASVDSMIGASFKGGSGSASFDALYSEWDLHTKNLLETLSGIATALNQTSTDIADVDATLGTRFQA